jgi:hypothetical protein
MARSTQRITAASGIRPSQGQSKQVDKPKRNLGLSDPSEPQASSNARKLSSTLRLTLARLWLSDTEITQATSPTPALRASSSPLALGTRTCRRRPAGNRARARTASVSASCGTALGLTKEPISRRGTPVAASSSIMAILRSVAMKGFTA